MKTHLFVFLLAAGLTLILASSCKKSSSGPAVSHWTFNNQTYVATSTAFSTTTTAHTLISLDTAISPHVTLELAFGHMPVSNSTFGVVNPFGGSIDSLHCAFGLLSGPVGSFNILGVSSGGGTVNVTIANGKVVATFTGVTISTSPSSSTTISGTMIEQ